MAKFINPFTDVGFKKIFGQEINKDVLIDFLNSLLEGERVITDIVFADKEMLPEQRDGRRLIYDIYCQTDTGEHIIVEMQNKFQMNFKGRVVYYLASDIARQGVKGEDWDYRITPVYCVCFMNFSWKDATDVKLRTDVILSDRDTGKQFCDFMRMIFIQLPLMDKEEDECENDFERWIYVLKNMETFDRMPYAAQKAVFDKLGSIAEIAAMPDKEREMYEESLKVYRDNLAIAAYEFKSGRAEGYKEGREDGREEGREEATRSMAVNMIRSGFDISQVVSITGLTEKEIIRLTEN